MHEQCGCNPSRQAERGCILKKTLSRAILLLPLTVGTSLLWAVPSFARGEITDLVARMEASYERVAGYRMETEVREYSEGRVADTKRFRYTFKKPHHLRIDMESPHGGMVLVYPDEDGKVIVRPGGLGSFVKLHLAPDSFLLRTSAGQRIDQTDLGLLIRHIRTSVTGRRGDDIKVTREDDRVLVEVLADDHFRAGVMTLYRFTIDTTRWLPAEVQELTPAGVPKRTVIFRNLHIIPDIPDSLFSIDKEN